MASKTSKIGQAGWTPYILLLPFLLTFSVFLAYPLVDSAILAFSQTYGPSHSIWVGFDNFKNLARDPDFWIALKNTFTYALASVTIP